MRSTSTHADLAHYYHAIHTMCVDDKRKMRNLNHLMVHFHFAMCFSLPSTVSFFIYFFSENEHHRERGGRGGAGREGQGGSTCGRYVRLQSEFSHTLRPLDGGGDGLDDVPSTTARFDAGSVAGSDTARLPVPSAEDVAAIIPAGAPVPCGVAAGGGGGSSEIRKMIFN